MPSPTCAYVATIQHCNIVYRYRCRPAVVEHANAVPKGHRSHQGNVGAGGQQKVPGHVQRPVHGEDPGVETDLRRADGQRFSDRGLGERGRHQVPPEVAQPGEVVPELPDQLDGPEQLGAQEAAALLRGAARDPQEEEEVRERGHVLHADGGGGRRHDRPGRARRRSRQPPPSPAPPPRQPERLGRDGRPGRHGRSQRRPLLRGQQFRARVQAVQDGPVGRVLDRRRRRRRRRRRQIGRRPFAVPRVVVPAPGPAAGRARADPGADGPRAPGHDGHARTALRPHGEADEGERRADPAARRHHGHVVAQQPGGRLRQRQGRPRRQVGRRVKS